MASALEGIKVVDLSRTLAGPFCTMLLGDMGADVIKIEEPEHGDETRAWGPFWNGEGGQFLTFNRNKRSLGLNLKEKEGIDIVLGLAAGADVMIESFRPGTLDRLGLGYEAIKQVNPKMVYCTISGYGRTGPMSQKPGYDLVIQAYSGLMNLTGEPDGPPLRVGFSLVDLFTGMMAYGSVVTALRHRDNTGEGQWIDTSLLDGQVAVMSYHGTNFLATGKEAHRMGSGHPHLVPYQSFPASDGFFILGCPNQRLWERLCHAIGCPELVEDPRFASNDDRVENRTDCVEALSRVFRTKPMAHWVQVIEDAGIPCGPIQTVADVVNDPQVLARNMMVDVDHPKVPGLRMPNCPLMLTGSPSTIRRHPPLLGEHNEDILSQSGYTPGQISELRKKRVIAG